MATHFYDEKASIDNPRESAAETFAALSNTLMNRWGKDLTDLTKLAASVYSNMLQMRRFVCLFVCLFVYCGVSLLS